MISASWMVRAAVLIGYPSLVPPRHPRLSACLLLPSLLGCEPALRPTIPQEPPAETAPLPETAPQPEPATPALAPVTTKFASQDEAQHFLQRELGVAFYQPRHRNNERYDPADGYLGPVASARDGGFVFGGQLSVDGVRKQVIGKIDGDGNLLWSVPLQESQYRAYEGGLVNQTPDGNYVGFVMAYPNPALNPQLIFAKISPTGQVLWRLPLPIDEHGNSAQVHIARVVEDSSIQVQGHLYRGKRGKSDRPAYRWSARITADGNLKDETSGSALDWAKDEW